MGNDPEVSKEWNAARKRYERQLGEAIQILESTQERLNEAPEDALGTAVFLDA